MKKALDSPIPSAGLLLSLQGPRGPPAVFAARSLPDTETTQRLKATMPALPMSPDDGSKPPPDPLVEVAQGRRGLAETEVAPPPRGPPQRGNRGGSQQDGAHSLGLVGLQQGVRLNQMAGQWVLLLLEMPSYVVTAGGAGAAGEGK